MREFRFEFKNVFKGLLPELKEDKEDPFLEECHNLVPLGDNFDIHKVITDLNATGVSWGGTGVFVFDVWEDDGSDVFTDDGSDSFIDE